MAPPAGSYRMSSCTGASAVDSFSTLVSCVMAGIRRVASLLDESLPYECSRDASASPARRLANLTPRTTGVRATHTVANPNGWLLDHTAGFWNRLHCSSLASCRSRAVPAAPNGEARWTKSFSGLGACHQPFPFAHGIQPINGRTPPRSPALLSATC